MSNLLFVGRRVQAGLLCCLLVLLCVSTAVGDPKPLSKEDQEKVDAAIDKGVAFLKKAQTKNGDFEGKMFIGENLVGQCALPAYALLESGVPAEDPVIQKAAEYIRARAPKITNNKTKCIYDLSLAILFFDRLNDPKDKKMIESLALRLIASQHRSGGWTYNCLSLSEQHEKEIVKHLGMLRKQMKDSKETRNKALESVAVPEKLRELTVFQPSNAQFLTETPGTLTGMTDNSSTQFAMLGLWAAQRYGIPVEPTFEIMVERFEQTHYPSGMWTYLIGDFMPQQSPSSNCSMTCVGLMALAIGRGLQLPSSGSPVDAEKDVHVLKGFATLARVIGKPTGQMGKYKPYQDVYFLWSLERVGMLYNIPEICGKDWYRWGAEILVANQTKRESMRGCWPGIAVNGSGMNYAPMLSTSFALLFLKRSHPMKDLTPKLPFTAEGLNRGVARLRRSDKCPIHPSGEKSSEASSQKHP